MHEEVNEKAVALCSRGVKMTGRMLAKMMQAYLRRRQKVKTNVKVKSPTQGKQSVNSLKKHGTSLADVEISGDNIGSFKRIAREHRLDFALKRDKSVDPPKWYVFFKAKDDRSLDSAFKKYSQLILNPKAKKPSLMERLAKIKEKLKTISAPVKNKNRGGPEL